ncbi:unnamed protein product [Cylicocyclus nassatus]|uniref:ShKT domain-containing protein n=1 Tax=Cylicocyclus nassatus TaxID=53992 RepID=A0AA36GJM8_CYLNA|nr:unnamed protein product [Cylicocyclus nassatus]
MAILSVVMIALAFYRAAAQQQECADPNANPTSNPCIMGACPTGQTCIQSPKGEMCCDSTKVTSVTAAPTSTCRDFVHPVTGVSDCPQRAHLCENAAYRQVMAEQCPRTCNKCPGTSTGGSTNCRDFVHPKTGVSDCPRNRALCTSAFYAQLMREQCPKTCGYCV